MVTTKEKTFLRANLLEKSPNEDGMGEKDDVMDGTHQEHKIIH